MIRQIYKAVDQGAHYIFRRKYATHSNKTYRDHFYQQGIALRKLTREQKEQIVDVWKVKNHLDFDTHELYYSLTGHFDPNICSEMLFRTTIDPLLNNRKLNLAWNDKCYFDRFLPQAHLPYTYVRNVNGVFYDHDYNLIARDAAETLVKERGKDSIIKPSMDSGLGRKVGILSPNADVTMEMQKYDSNYLIQDIIKQHPVMAQLSPKSVNILRMHTLFVNGSVRPLITAVRASTEDQIAANGNGGAEDLAIIGVHPDGSLMGKALFKSGKMVEVLPNGTMIKGIHIPNYSAAIDAVVKAHEVLGHFGLLAWDVAIDECGEPVIIEYNLNGMGIFLYQMVCGPLFGENTRDIVELLERKTDTKKCVNERVRSKRKWQ